MTVSVLLATASAAMAAPFADPTRPPSASAAAGEETPSGPRVESVILSPGRHLAVIDGRVYRAGDVFGDGRIVSIAPEGVAIRRGTQTEILRLYPEFRKRVEKDKK